MKNNFISNGLQCPGIFYIYLFHKCTGTIRTPKIKEAILVTTGISEISNLSDAEQMDKPPFLSVRRSRSPHFV
jgi:hypothetical protein